MIGWRDRLPVHPAADLFPSIAGDELCELGDDIKANGLQSAVVLLRPKGGGESMVLDGRNRLDAMELVGLPVVGDDGRLSVRFETIDETRNFDPVAYVISANFRRRHLTGEQRDDLIRKVKQEHPELSIRTVAEITGIPRSTVARAVDTPGDPEPTPTSEGVPVGTPATKPPEHPAPVGEPRVIGRDGKSYSATRKPRVRSAPRRDTPRYAIPPSQARAQTIMSFSTLLHRQLAETLDDLVRLLGDERGRIAEMIPFQKRVVIARGYLTALGVTLDDLQPIEDA